LCVKKTLRILFYYFHAFTDVFLLVVCTEPNKKPPEFIPTPFFLKSDREANISVFFLTPFQYQTVLKGIFFCVFFSYRIHQKWRKSSEFSPFRLLRDTNIYVYFFSHYICFVPNSLPPAPQGTVFKNLIVQISISSPVDLYLLVTNLRYLKTCQKIRINEIHFLSDLQSIIYPSTVLQYRMHRPIIVL